nr:immunity 52 family protein [Corallococcus sp. AS-1-6]
MPPDVPMLTEQFRLGVNREKGGPAIERLGYGFWFGNGGRDYDRASLRIYSGGYSEAGSNSCVLTLPTLGRSPNAERLMTTPVLMEVVRSMALAWEPEWAVAMSHAHRDMEDPASQEDISLGWVTYLSRDRGTVPPLPAPVRIEPVEDKGTLIILTPDRFTATNPEHIELARRVRELLARAGLMRSAAS